MSRRLFSLIPLALAVYCVFHYDFLATVLSYSSWRPVLIIPSQHLQHHPQPFTRHIVAVGDLHGDFTNARKVLEFSRVIDAKGDWSGEVDFFVQTGDIIDRYMRSPATAILSDPHTEAQIPLNCSHTWTHCASKRRRKVASS